MHILFWIIGSTVIVSLLAFIGIFFLSFKEKLLSKLLLFLVALSAGALMGGAFLHLIPESYEGMQSVNVFIYILIGFVLFFILEKVLHWRHCHKDKCSVHSFAYMNLVGDALHNLIDGFIIAAAFMTSIELKGLIEDIDTKKIREEIKNPTKEQTSIMDFFDNLQNTYIELDKTSPEDKLSDLETTKQEYLDKMRDYDTEKSTEEEIESYKEKERKVKELNAQIQDLEAEAKERPKSATLDENLNDFTSYTYETQKKLDTNMLLTQKSEDIDKSVDSIFSDIKILNWLKDRIEVKGKPNLVWMLEDPIDQFQERIFMLEQELIEEGEEKLKEQDELVDSREKIKNEGSDIKKLEVIQDKITSVLIKLKQLGITV